MQAADTDAAAGLRALVAAAGARLGHGASSADRDPLRALLADPALAALFFPPPAPPPAGTPVQQTRSGRISRPPAVPLHVHAQLHALAHDGRALAGPEPAPRSSGGVTNGAAQAAQAAQAAHDAHAAHAARAASSAHAAFAAHGEPRVPKRARVVSPDHARFEQDSAPSPATESDRGAAHGGPRRRLAASELLERRRARNRKAADTSRRKKKAQMEDLTESLARKTDECDELEQHCADLEARVDELERYIAAAGLRVPGHAEAARPRVADQPLRAPHPPTRPEPAPAATLPAHLSADTPAGAALPAGLLALPSGLDVRNSLSPGPPSPTPRPAGGVAAAAQADTPASLLTDDDGTPMLSFDALFNIDYDSAADDNDAADGDFVPPTSPHRHSSDVSDDEGEGESEGEGEGDGGRGRAVREDGARGSAGAPGPAGSGSERGSESGVDDEDDEGDDDDDDDDDHDHNDDDDDDGDEEEDLFLPIEDVPVPVDELYDDAMRGLGVRSRDELASVVRRMVETAGRGGPGGAGAAGAAAAGVGARAGVSSEQVDALRRVIMLAEAQGIYRAG